MRSTAFCRDRGAKPPPRMKGEAASGEPCHFPFRYQRKMHHSCLRDGLHGCQSWCATTKNYDRDHKWTRCGEDKRLTGAAANASPSDPCGGVGGE
ncbi:unnamed protein product [Eretmochelys imbricata]